DRARRRAAVHRHAGRVQRHRARPPAGAGRDGHLGRADHRHRHQPLRRSHVMSKIHWPYDHRPEGAAIHEASTAIAQATPEEVWAWLVRPDRWAEYYANVSKVRHRAGPWPAIATGTKFSWVTFHTKVTTVVTECEPFARLAWTGGGLGSVGHHAWLLTPTDDGR